MIGYIEGEIVGNDERSVLLLTAGGVGYRVFLADRTPECFPPLGDRAAFYTHLAVREDALDLYGFETERDLGMFRALLSVSGVGPKSAAGILVQAGTDALLQAIRSHDAVYLVKTSGIGKKTAEKIVLELRDKDALLPPTDIGGGVSSDLSPEREALDALEALGYTARDVREIVRLVAKEEREVTEIIRRTLQEMGRKL